MRPFDYAAVEPVVAKLTNYLGYPAVPSPSIEHVIFLLRAAERHRDELQQSIRDAQALVNWHKASEALRLTE